LRDRVSEIEVTGDGFTRNSEVKVIYEFNEQLPGGLQPLRQGDPRVTSANDVGHFEGVTFSVPSGAFNINVAAEDIVTGQKAVAGPLRPAV